MSRSRKKTPIMGIAGNNPDQKKFKQQEHQRERTHVRCLINAEKFDSIPSKKKFGNEWGSPRDGKMWMGDCKYKYSLDYLKWMRK